MNILYSYLLVWLVYISVGSSLANLNSTYSSPESNRITGDGRPSNKNEDTKLNITNIGAADGMEDSRLGRALQPKEIPTAWGTRDMFSRRRGRDLMQRYSRHSMSPRSFPRGRRFGYRDRFPGRFSRYAPSYGEYEPDKYGMGNYGSYPQRFPSQNSMYGQQPFAQSFPTYRPTGFAPQSRSPYYGTQTSLQPQPSPASAHSYYPHQYNMQSERQPPRPYFQQESNVPSMYYTNRPASKWDNQEPEIHRNGGSAQFQTPIQPAASETQSQMMATLPNRENVTGLLELSRTAPSQSPDQRAGATPLPQENRYQPSRLGAPRTESGDPRDAVRPQRIAAATADETRDRPVESEWQPEGSTRPTGQRDRDRLAKPQEQNRRRGDQAVESASSDQLSTSSALPTQTPVPQENPGQQPDAQRPLSGLLSFFRSPTESNNIQSARSVVEPALPRISEQPTLAQVAPQVAVAA